MPGARSSSNPLTLATPPCGTINKHGPKSWLSANYGMRRLWTASTRPSSGLKTVVPSTLPKGISDMADPTRGEIWLGDLGTGIGHEQQGKRPILVLSVDAFNHGPAGLAVVLPLTSKTAKSRNIPAHILVNPPEAGLKSPSMILCDQLRTISKDRLTTRWG